LAVRADTDVFAVRVVAAAGTNEFAHRLLGFGFVAAAFIGRFGFAVVVSHVAAGFGFVRFLVHCFIFFFF
jgi:hypothetical protein